MTLPVNLASHATMVHVSSFSPCLPKLFTGRPDSFVLAPELQLVKPPPRIAYSSAREFLAPPAIKQHEHGCGDQKSQRARLGHDTRHETMRHATGIRIESGNLALVINAGDLRDFDAIVERGVRIIEK